MTYAEAETVYDSLCGFLVPEAALPGVPDAFAPGGLCHGEAVLADRAITRLRTRLDTAGEEDLDCLLGTMEAIRKHLCLYCLTVPQREKDRPALGL